MKQIRILNFVSAGTVTLRTYQGSEHLVVPIVALVEGVIHPMNAPAPELVRAEEFSRVPAGWNGRPVFLGHPMRDGEPVSGNIPEVLESDSIGLVFNAGIKKKKLTMEAWVNTSRANAATVKRLKSGQPIEISVGVFVETDDTTGEYNGKTYEGEWHNIVPDHLALLPEGDLGACSREMGCGVRAAAQKGTSVAKEKDRTHGGLFVHLMDSFRGAVSTTESDRDVRDAILTALRKMEPQVYDVIAVYSDRVVYPVYEAGGVCLYQRAYTGSEADGYEVDGNRVEVAATMTYEPVVAGAAAVTDDKPAAVATLKSAAASPTTGEVDMTKTERIKALIAKGKTFTQADEAMLITASDEQLERFEKFDEVVAPVVAAETPCAKAAREAAAAATPAVASAAPTTPTTPKVLSEAEYLATLPAEMADSMREGLRVGKAKKAASIKALKDSGRCDLTDAELGAKTQGELDSLVKLSGVEVKALVDFSGLGTARVDGDKPAAIPAAPDLNAAIRAARAKK